MAMQPAYPLTLVAMIAFAANSLLARLALGAGAVDAASYTVIRLVSGALLLAVLAGVPRQVVRLRPGDRLRWGGWLAGSWIGAGALFGYALAFSLAYLMLGAATGALVLFTSVQATMLAAGLARGDRPRAGEWLGLAIAFAGFVYLVLPGVGAPDPLGCALMIGAGIAWGIYTLSGRGSRDPLAQTAGNFIRATVLCVPLALWAVSGGHVTPAGAGLAVLSGAVASGLGYAIWYRALAALTTLQAGVVQLSVPVLAAAGGVMVLGEAMTGHALAAGATTLCGIALALLARSQNRPG